MQASASESFNRDNFWQTITIKIGITIIAIPFLIAAIFGLSLFIIFNFKKAANTSFWTLEEKIKTE